jgi:AmmeMemoRadiSam system protein A
MIKSRQGQVFGRGVASAFVFYFLVFWVALPPKHALAQGMPTSNSNNKGSLMAEPGKLNESEGKWLLDLARKTIEHELFGRELHTSLDSDTPAIFHERRGTFVTLTIDNRLRGCIGHITPQESILEGVKTNAVNAAFRDPRFRPLDRKEYEKITIEVSILTDPIPLSYSGEKDLLKKLRAGIDGVILKKGHYQSTFLPQVWDQLPSKEQFLSHLCLKAGLDEDAWRKGDLEISTYQVQAFEE